MSIKNKNRRNITDLYLGIWILLSEYTFLGGMASHLTRVGGPRGEDDVGVDDEGIAVLLDEVDGNGHGFPGPAVVVMSRFRDL